MDWGKNDLEKKLRDFRLNNSEVKQVRILLVGEVRVGKSSFINSINTGLQGRITSSASGISYTKAYESHFIKREDGSPLPFVFNDVMGFESKGGVQVQDIILALKGILEEGYRFNPESPMSKDDQHYRSNPAPADKIFCLVNVMAADKVSVMDKEVIDKMKEIRQEASKLNIPQVIIMTKVDEACPVVRENLQKVYTSKRIKEKMVECSKMLGVPMSTVFPVKNYHEEIDTNDVMDVLNLKAFNHIVNLAQESLLSQQLEYSSEFDKPWRMMPWGNKNDLIKKLRDFQLNNPEVQQVRILVVGDVGAGKSSFINSVNNAFQGRITSSALVDTTSGTSFTKAFKTHYIKGEDGSNLPFVFNDVMGIESKDGVQVEDIITAIKGSLVEGYRFNPASPMSTDDQRYRSNPTPADKIFCLVNVMAADTVSLLEKEVIDKLKYIREKVSELYVPQVIIMTKVDNACPLVMKNLQKVYTSKKIKKKMKVCSNLLGVPMNHIFPLKNYHEKVDTEIDMDVLILKALDQIVSIAKDALFDVTSCKVTEPHS